MQKLIIKIDYNKNEWYNVLYKYNWINSVSITIIVSVKMRYVYQKIEIIEMNSEK